MKGKTIVVLVLCLTAILFFAPTHSVPLLINYQGRINNAAGQPVTGTVNLTFSFYSAATAGTKYLQVYQPGIVVSGGMYVVLIGSGTVTPGTELDLAAVFQKHPAVFMGVKAGSDAEMTPRARIGSAPFALSVDMAQIGAFIASSDWDGDTYPKTGTTPDCNDGDAAIHPGAPEVGCNGIDEDCDGLADDCLDGDGDNWDTCAVGTVNNLDGQGVDCNDFNPMIFPGAPEYMCDFVDSNCDGFDCLCTMYYDPVCGADMQTYSNEGCAACACVPVMCYGPCPCW